MILWVSMNFSFIPTFEGQDNVNISASITLLVKSKTLCESQALCSHEHLFSKCSFFRNDYFHIWLSLRVCPTLILFRKAKTLCFSQHMLMERNHSHSSCIVFYQASSWASTIFSLSPLIQTEFSIVSYIDSRSFPIVLCVSPRVIQIRPEIMLSQLVSSYLHFLMNIPQKRTQSFMSKCRFSLLLPVLLATLHDLSLGVGGISLFFLMS